MKEESRGFHCIRRDENELTHGSPTYRSLKKQAIAAFETYLFTSLLEEHGGNISKVARVLQMDRKYLYDRLVALGLRQLRSEENT